MNTSVINCVIIDASSGGKISSREDDYFSPLSRLTVRLECTCEDGSKKFATGFFVHSKNKLFLISNYHVFSGKEWECPRTCRSPEPKEITLKLRPRNHDDLQSVAIKLKSEDGSPSFLTASSQDDDKIPDVAAIEVSLDFDNLDVLALDFDNLSNVKNFRLKPSDAVSIIGYPYGLSNYNEYPIWKSGEIASEPGLCYLGQAAILVDARTKGAMSGSPTFVRYESKGWFRKRREFAFVGVYSGRLTIPQEYKSRFTEDQLDGIQSKLASDVGIIWAWDNLADVLGLFPKYTTT